MTRSATAASPNAIGKAVAPTRRRDRKETEERLFQAGLEVMSAVGYEAATTRRIAELAGVNEQLLTRYFGGKAGLLVAILRRHLETEPALERELYVASDGSLLEEVRAFLGRADFTDAEEPFARLALGRAIVDPAMAGAIRELYLEAYAPLLQERLAYHQGRGEIAADADLAELVRSLIFLRLGLTAYARMLFGERGASLTTTVQQSAETFVRGIAVIGATPRPTRTKSSKR